MSITKQIPLINYFDEEVFKREQNLLFSHQPVYLGAASQLKKPGDFQVLERLDGDKILVNNGGEILLLDNRCAHRQAKVSNGHGNSSHFICPLHHWKYGNDGHCISTPLMKDIDRSQYSLPRNEYSQLNDLLFTGPNSAQLVSDLKSFPFAKWMDLESMVYHKTYSEEFDCNWKHYIEVFAENYHVPFVHPGFSQFVDLKNLEWHQHQRFTGQIFKMKSSQDLNKANLTPNFQKWVGLLKEYYGHELPPYAGILILCYPNIIIECYPLCMAVGTIHSKGPEKFFSHVDFFHHKDILLKHPEIARAAEEALNETELEDKDICAQLAAGRRSLRDSSQELLGPIHDELEKGLDDFYRYYHQRMNQKPTG